MKVNTAFALLLVSPMCATQAQAQNPQNQPTQGEFYIDSLANIQEEPTAHDMIRITLPFNTSNRTRGARVFTEDCTTHFNTNHVYFEAETTDPTSSVDDGYIQFDTTVDMNVTALNGTTYWNPFTDGSRGGWAEVCVETYLSLTTATENEEVDFVSNVLNVSVSLDGNFTVDDISVKRENVTESTSVLDYSAFVTAYQCDSNSPRDVLTTPPLYNQGDTLVICVRDDDGGIVQVEDIQELVISQTGTASYNYIVGNLFNPEITSVRCIPGTESQGSVCIAELILVARFFPDTTPADLTVTGVVDVVRGGYTPPSGSRALRMATKQNIAEESVAVQSNSGNGRRSLTAGDNGAFSLSVKVGADDADASAGSNHHGSVGLMSVALGAAGAALLM